MYYPVHFHLPSQTSHCIAGTVSLGICPRNGATATLCSRGYEWVSGSGVLKSETRSRTRCPMDSAVLLKTCSRARAGACQIRGCGTTSVISNWSASARSGVTAVSLPNPVASARWAAGRATAWLAPRVHPVPMPSPSRPGRHHYGGSDHSHDLGDYHSAASLGETQSTTPLRKRPLTTSE